MGRTPIDAIGFVLESFPSTAGLAANVHFCIRTGLDGQAALMAMEEE